MKQKKLIRSFALFSSYCLLLLSYRIWVTDSKTYVFLIWNLFLAYIPFIISLVLMRKKTSWFFFYLLLLSWLFFLPNAPYIMTDIFHLSGRSAMPEWYDLLLVTSFATNGILFFYSSLFAVHKILINRYSKIVSHLLINIFIFLTGFGIYLGRFLRWNTWDIIASPKLLLLDILERFINPLAYQKTWGVTIGFAIFLFLGFEFIRAFLAEGLLTNKNHQNGNESTL